MSRNPSTNAPTPMTVTIPKTVSMDALVYPTIRQKARKNSVTKNMMAPLVPIAGALAR